MKVAKTLLAGAMLAGFGTLAFAQQQATGLVTTINRLAGTIGIEQSAGTTVGASNAIGSETRPAEQFKVQSNSMLDAVHAGDRVSFTVNSNNGVNTITKIERQK